MDDVREIREAAGGTVNDVMLTVLTRALARYVKLHGESVGQAFRAHHLPPQSEKNG